MPDIIARAFVFVLSSFCFVIAAGDGEQEGFQPAELPALVAGDYADNRPRGYYGRENRQGDIERQRRTVRKQQHAEVYCGEQRCEYYDAERERLARF